MRIRECWAVVLLVAIFIFGGCSTDSVSDSHPTGNKLSGIVGLDGPADVSSIAISTSPITVSALGTVAVTASLKDSAGLKVPDGTSVLFSVTPLLGSITSTATTVSGLATATFTANATAGTVEISAAAGGITGKVTLTILGVNVGSIEFTSAVPNAIGVKGSGQQETSLITFTVKDVNGQPASSGTEVTFSLNGPNGGESLEPQSASTKAGGIVTTTLQSGSVAGPVRVTATTNVGAGTITTSSTGVSIGGGKPSLSHMTLARTVINLAGLSYVNLQSTVSVFLADRFGNFNVLEGTSVSFMTKSGAIDASAVTDATGSTSVIYRTQAPNPLVYSAANPFVGSSPSLVGDPVNGHAMVIAMTQGEECFVDKNGNGVFDGTIIDDFPVGLCDLPEPFVDENDSGTYDTTELFVDDNGDGVFTVANGVWDGDLTIWQQARIAITGGPSQITIFPASFTIADGGSQSFTACVADQNANPLMAGSTLEVTTTSGTLAGGDKATLSDRLSGPNCRSFALSDPSPGDTNPPVPASIEFKGIWKVLGKGDVLFSRIASGTID